MRVLQLFCPRLRLEVEGESEAMPRLECERTKPMIWKEGNFMMMIMMIGVGGGDDDGWEVKDQLSISLCNKYELVQLLMAP